VKRQQALAGIEISACGRTPIPSLLATGGTVTMTGDTVAAGDIPGWFLAAARLLQAVIQALHTIETQLRCGIERKGQDPGPREDMRFVLRCVGAAHLRGLAVLDLTVRRATVHEADEADLLLAVSTRPASQRDSRLSDRAVAAQERRRCYIWLQPGR
jgi:hypothetical protein